MDDRVAAIINQIHAACFESVTFAVSKSGSVEETAILESIQGRTNEIETAITAIIRDADAMRPVVAVAESIQQALGERPVDITNETRWELDPTLLNVLAWELNAYRAVTKE